MPAAVPWTVYCLACLLAVLAAAAANGEVLAKVDGKSIFRSLQASDCSVDCNSRQRRPVCGTDGVTYDSRCDLKRAKKCDGKKIKVRKKGKCQDNDHSPPADAIPKCSELRQEVEQKMKTSPSDVVLPSCVSDGSYAEVQCHKHTGFCWCVTKEGRHIPGTSVKGKRPRCRGGRRRKKKVKRNKKKRGCTRTDRQLFNSNLVAVFKEEYDRVVRGTGTTPASAQGSKDVDMERTVVEWKFTELDKDSDNILQFRDIRAFRRMVKKLIKPKTCAKRFLKNCDSNKNKGIERSEWTLCLGIDIKASFQLFVALNSGDQSTEAPTERILPEEPPFLHAPGRQTSFPAIGNTPLNPKPERTIDRKTSDNPIDKRDCMEERRNAMLSDEQEPTNNHYIPRCAPDGKWAKAQCHRTSQVSEYCWCVEETTGVPIPYTSTFRKDPNCTMVEEREMKGCPFEQKRRFLVELMDDLMEEMTEQNKSAAAVGARNSGASREAVARWKLHTLDSNRNGVLDRKEWKAIRKTNLKNKKYPRKCRRNFLRYCDENNDRKVTWDEWKDCLGVHQSYFNALPINPKRKGQKNPFIDQLT